MATKKIEIKLSQSEDDMQILKMLADGYSFANIHDYCLYVLQQGINQDIKMLNNLIKADAAKAGEAGVEVNVTAEEAVGDTPALQGSDTEAGSEEKGRGEG